MPAAVRYAVRPADDKAQITPVVLPVAQPGSEPLAVEFATTLIEEHHELAAPELREDLFAFRLHRFMRLVVALAARRGNSIEAKLPLAREARSVYGYGLVHPRWLAITDSEETDMHRSPVGCGRTPGGADRPELLQVIELTHLRQHDVYERVLQVEQDPLAALFTLDTNWAVAGRFRFFSDIVDQRLDVAIGRAAGNNHVIGHGCRVPDVEPHDIPGFHVIKRFHDEVGQIIVATVDAERVEELLAADRVALGKLIRKE